MMMDCSQIYLIWVPHNQNFNARAATVPLGAVFTDNAWMQLCVLCCVDFSSCMCCWFAQWLFCVTDFLFEFLWSFPHSFVWISHFANYFRYGTPCIFTSPSLFHWDFNYVSCGQVSFLLGFLTRKRKQDNNDITEQNVWLFGWFSVDFSDFLEKVCFVTIGQCFAILW